MNVDSQTRIFVADEALMYHLPAKMTRMFVKF